MKLALTDIIKNSFDELLDKLFVAVVALILGYLLGLTKGQADGIMMVDSFYKDQRTPPWAQDFTHSTGSIVDQPPLPFVHSISEDEATGTEPQEPSTERTPEAPAPVVRVSEEGRDSEETKQ